VPPRFGFARAREPREDGAARVDPALLAILKCPRCGEGLANDRNGLCCGNGAVFREQSFDTVVGRSVLHHLLDYEDVLATLRTALRDGGLLVVFKPVLHGKTVLSLLMGMILKAHEKGWQDVLDEEEQKRLARLVHHETKSAWYPQDRESVARLGDKSIFDVDGLLSTARALGYSQAQFRQVGETDASDWPYLSHTLAVTGIPRDKLPELKWVCDVFAQTYGLVLGHTLTRPMGYFVLRR